MSDTDKAAPPPEAIAGLARVLHHAVESSASYDQTIAATEQAGHSDIADFLRQVQQADQRRAAKAHQLLAQHAGDDSKGDSNILY